MKKILISRTDNIGDVILSTPLADLIKSYYPEAQVTYLVRRYTADIVSLFPNIDQIIIYDDLIAEPQQQAIETIKKHGFDTHINVSPKSYDTAKLAKQAGIPMRIGTSRRIFHWWTCNKLVNFSRKKSSLHEAQLNINLLKPLNIPVTTLLEKQPLAFYFPKPSLPKSASAPVKEALTLSGERFKLAIHPGSNANGREWPFEYFISLIKTLNPEKFQIYFTGNDKENQKFSAEITQHLPNAINVMGQFTLSELAQFITNLDGLIASGTGPLHLAAALGIHTLGLFPPLLTAGPSRWQPLGEKAQYLALPKNCLEKCSNTCCACMKAITPNQVSTITDQWLKEKNGG